MATFPAFFLSPEALASIHRAIDAISATCAKLADAFREENEKMLRDPIFAARLRRLLWTGIARRHAERPPTRGFWARRCGCLACRERKGLT